jgi:hypothetical protein
MLTIYTHDGQSACHISTHWFPLFDGCKYASPMHFNFSVFVEHVS